MTSEFFFWHFHKVDNYYVKKGLIFLQKAVQKLN